MMKALFAAACAVSFFVAAPAGAQYSALPQTAGAIYNSCLSITGASVSDPRVACACVTGYMGGTMSDRDFEISAWLLKIGEMSENGAPDDQIASEVASFFSRGFTEQDVARVGAMVEQAGTRGDQVCGQFEGPGSV